MPPSNAATVQAIPQLSYLELITMVVGNRPIGSLWQRFSGGGVTIATARSAPPNMRTTIPMSGKYTVAGIQLEREYIPDDSHVSVLFAIMAHLKDPANRDNGIKIIREINNSPTGNAATKTKVTYIGCVPTNIPLLEDGDTTADATIMPTRVSFVVSDVSYNVGGREMDVMQYIGGGFGGSGTNAMRGLQALNFNNTRGGNTTTR